MQRALDPTLQQSLHRLTQFAPGLNGVRFDSRPFVLAQLYIGCNFLVHGHKSLSLRPRSAAIHRFANSPLWLRCLDVALPPPPGSISSTAYASGRFASPASRTNPVFPEISTLLFFTVVLPRCSQFDFSSVPLFFFRGGGNGSGASPNTSGRRS